MGAGWIASAGLHSTLAANLRNLARLALGLDLWNPKWNAEPGIAAVNLSLHLRAGFRWQFSAQDFAQLAGCVGWEKAV